MLPTIDFSRYTEGDSLQLLEVAQQIVDGLRKHGAIKLINYDPTSRIADDFLGSARDFLSLSLNTKMKIANPPGPVPQRGYSAVGTEQTSRLFEGNLIGHKSWDGLRDVREHFDAGPSHDTDYPNQWPAHEKGANFEQAVESLYATLQKISEQILSAIELGFGIPKNELLSLCQPVASEIRLNRYPPVRVQDLSDDGLKRTWPHTDLGIISLVFQDKIGGLEVEERSLSSNDRRSFAPIPPASDGKPPEVLVLASDTLQRWTNGVIRAGLHQVSVPQGMRGKANGECPERYSGIFFLKAHRDASVAPLHTFVTDDRPAAYEEVSALKFQQLGTAKLY
ncbi:putative gibberellin 20-oxidase [Xylariaceae sp. FL1272]|nr:putative gibberellin 20-oxidase [Xylariaceae sp. FL1272]